MQRKCQQQQHAEVEVRQREAGEGEQAADAIHRAAAAHRGPAAQRQPDDDAEEQGGDGEFNGVGEVGGEQRVDRRAIGHGLAEIAAQGLADEGDVLQPQWLIEAELVTEGGDGVGGGEFAEGGDGGIAGQDPQRQEHQCQHQQNVGITSSRRRTM